MVFLPLGFMVKSSIEIPVFEQPDQTIGEWHMGLIFRI
jgi:hypothetical protein